MNDDGKLKSSAQAKFLEYLHSKKLRRTPERLVILEAVMGTKDHFTVEQLYENIVAGKNHLSLGTVYNNIELLLDAGLLRRHSFGVGQVQYETVKTVGGNHLHLVCLHCGAVKEKNEPELIRRLSDMKFRAFAADYFDLTVYGTCSKCRRKMNKKE